MWSLLRAAARRAKPPFQRGNRVDRPLCAGAVQGPLASVREPAEGLAATAAGLVFVFVGATTVFAELQDALDRIWRVPGRTCKSGWLTLIRAGLVAFGMILAVGFLLMVSLVTSAILAVVGRHLGSVFGVWQVAVEVVNAFSGFLLVAFMFGRIYKVMLREPAPTGTMTTPAGTTGTDPVAPAEATATSSASADTARGDRFTGAGAYAATSDKLTLVGREAVLANVRVSGSWGRNPSRWPRAAKS